MIANALGWRFGISRQTGYVWLKRLAPAHGQRIAPAGRVPNAFKTEYLAIRPLDRDSLHGIFFGATQVIKIDLKTPD